MYLVVWHTGESPSLVDSIHDFVGYDEAVVVKYEKGTYYTLDSDSGDWIEVVE